MTSKKRLISLFLTAILVFAAVPFAALPAGATQSRTEYFNTNYTLTGDPAQDIVNVAMTQKDRSKSAMGYTEAWCADFVCDCAKLAGLPDTVIPYNYSSRGGVRYLYSYMIDNCGATVVTTPQKGDLVYYKCTTSGNWCHVGIMVDSTNSIQGNVSEKVYYLKYTSYRDSYYNSSTHTGGECYTVTFVRPNYGQTSTTYRHLFPVHDGTIKYVYGYSSAYGSTFHTGIDIHETTDDDTIYSACNGTVEVASDPCPHWAEYFNGGSCTHVNGNYIRIKNEDGTYSYYFHLLQGTLKVKKGDKVVAGQPIASMGASGQATGKHLHYEVRTATDNSTHINTNPVSEGGVINYYYSGYQVIAANVTYSTITDGTYYIKNKSTQQYLTVSGSSSDTYPNVSVSASNSSAAQRFTISGTNKQYTLRSLSITDKYVNPYYTQWRMFVSGSNICLASSDKESNNDQHWGFEAVSEGYIIRNLRKPKLVLALDGTNVVVKDYTGESDQIWTLESVTAPATYTVSYNARGGSGAPASQTKTHGVPLTLSTQTPAREGYTFGGWSVSTNVTDKIYQPGESYTEDKDITLNAMWCSEYHGNKVSFDFNGGNVGVDVFKQDITVINGARQSGYTVLFTYSNSLVTTNYWGREFAVDSDGKVVGKRAYNSEEELKVPEGGFVVSMHGTSGAYDLWEYVDIGDYCCYDKAAMKVYVSKSPQVLYAYAKYVQSGGAVGTLPSAKRDGYTFDGWYTSANGGTKISSNTAINGAVTYYAHWTQTAPAPDTPDMGAPNADAKFDIELSTAPGEAAGEIKVVAAVKNITAFDISLIEFELHYSEGLTLVYGEDEDIGGDGEFLLDNYAIHPGKASSWESLSRLHDGYIRVKYLTTNGTATAKNDGDLVFTFIFRKNDNANNVEYAWIPSSAVEGFSSDIDDSNAFKGNGSLVEIKTFRLGDISGDGDITAIDYLMVKRAVLGTFTMTSEQRAAADVNGDGEVGAIDYVMIKRHILGTYHII